MHSTPGFSVARQRPCLERRGGFENTLPIVGSSPRICSGVLTEVAGQAPSTIDAKRRDLSRFFVLYAKLYGHDHPGE